MTDLPINPQGVNDLLAEAPAERIIRWAVDAFAPGLAVSSSFGAESACLLHLATRVWPDIPVLFVNTGFLFAETLRFRDELAERLNLRACFCPRPPRDPCYSLFLCILHLRAAENERTPWPTTQEPPWSVPWCLSSPTACIAG